MDFRKLPAPLIIAEIGMNHEGDEAVAADLIVKAAKAGADFVKFQTFTTSHFISSVQPERVQRLSGFELSRDAFRRLATVASEQGVGFFSTPLSIDDLSLVNELSAIIKIASGDITYLSLIQAAAKTGKPVILSTGLATEQEIDDAVQAFKAVRPDFEKGGSLMLMHCVSAYPTPDSDANLRNISWLSDRFGLPVGYSDHTLGIKACELAVAAGAVAVEKHFTYRKENQVFHDHAISADPVDLADMVKAIRKAEVLLGRYERARTDGEVKILEYARRSLAAACAIPKGTIIAEDMLTCLRPAWGIDPKNTGIVIGRALKRDLEKGELIKVDDIDGGL